jgi:hypothetical protein
MGGGVVQLSRWSSFPWPSEAPVLATHSSSHTGTIRSGLKLGIAAVIVIALLPFAQSIGGLLGAVPNPFASTHQERVQPPVLQSLQDLSEYHAASANLSAVVESSNDADYLPGFIKGEDMTYLAVGSVDAVIDFGSLAGNAIANSADGKSVTVTLPEPTYAEPRLDLENSKVLSHNRGLFDRIGSVLGDTTNEQPLLDLGQRALSDAAAGTELVGRAKTNTTSMLTSMLRALGFDQVTIVFQPPPVTP